MAKKLSEHMVRSIAAIKAIGGKITLTTGGMVRDSNGNLIEYKAVAGSTCACRGINAHVSTNNVYALERRGILRRMNIDKRHWRDTYELVEIK